MTIVTKIFEILKFSKHLSELEEEPQFTDERDHMEWLTLRDAVSVNQEKRVFFRQINLQVQSNEISLVRDLKKKSVSWLQE